MKNYIIELPSEEEMILGFVTDDIGTRGCIGCVIGGFTLDGSTFGVWLSTNAEYLPEDFEYERDNIMSCLEADILQNEFTLKKYCERKRGALIGGGSLDRTYLFKIGTQKYSYFLRVQISRVECRFYIFCYENAAMREYLDVAYAREFHEHIADAKIFRIKDEFIIAEFGCYDELDCAALVYLRATKDDIINASKCDGFYGFYQYLQDKCELNVIKAGTPEFRANFDSFIKRKADYTGCTEETMNALIRSVSEV